MSGVERLIEKIKLGALAVALAISSCTAPTQIITPTSTRTPKPTFTFAPTCTFPTHTPTATYIPPTLVPTYTPLSTPTPIPPPIPTMPFDEQKVSELHSELLEIIKELEPEVIGFGELHTIFRETSYYPSTTNLFARYLLELLQKEDFNNLVWEGLFHDFPEEELEEHYRTGAIKGDSLLSKALTYNLDLEGALSFLSKSAELGLNLYGSNITFEEYSAILKNCLPEPECENEVFNKMLELISTHATEQANELLALEKKVMLYGGELHNNLVEEVAGENVSFGDDINTDSYLEVDLIDPSLVYIYKSIGYVDHRSLVARLKACGLKIDLLNGGVYRFSSGNMNRVVVLYPCRFENCENVLFAE